MGALVLLSLSANASLHAQNAPTGEEPLQCPAFTLEDQDQASHAVTFPRDTPLVLLIGDRESRKDIPPWVEVLCALGVVPDAKVPPEHKQKSDAAKAAGTAEKKPLPEADLFGVADLRGVPDSFMWLVRRTGKGDYKHPVLLDQKGALSIPLKLEKGIVRVCVMNGAGEVVAIVTGDVDQPEVDALRAAFEKLGKTRPKAAPAATAAASVKP